MDYRRKIIASSPHLASASGAIATFSDGTDLPLNSISVDINPIQDLHGQNAPYPAGGGKNLLDPSLLKDQAAWNTILLNVKANTKYTMSTDKPSNDLYTYFNNTGTQGGSSSNAVISVHPVTITSTSEGYVYVTQRRASGNDSFQNYHFQIEEGETATAYAPYSNICPISGWTGCEVNRTGINVWDEEWEICGINWSTFIFTPAATGRFTSKNYIPVVPNNTYYANLDTRNTVIAGYTDASGSGGRSIPVNNHTDKLFTVPSDVKFIKFGVNNYGATYNHDISINYPSTDHSYHPYTGTSITISLGQTVYGGKLNVISGVLTLNKGYAEFDGSNDETWEVQNNAFVTNVSGIYNQSSTASTKIVLNSNIFKPLGIIYRGSASDNSIFKTVGLNEQIGIRYDALNNDVPSWRTFLSNNHLQVPFELATPQTYQLDPQTVRSLVGQNNIFADTGNVALDYWAHP